jgi:ribonuclease Z
MKFELTILGTSAAMPYKNRYLAGQILNIQEELYLIDCGEATMFRFQHLGIRHTKIKHIFISHLHGDHCFGIFGLLTSMAMLGRETPIHIYAPEGMEAMVEAVFKASRYKSPFKIHFFVLNTVHVGNPSSKVKEGELILENEKITVHSFPLNHRMPTCGFIFREKTFARNIIPEKIKEFNLTFDNIKSVKEGFDLKYKDPNLRDIIIPNSELTKPSLLRRSYAYCSDTTYFEPVLPHIEGVDLLYHEATFLDDMRQHAFEAGHSTALEAGIIAQKAHAKKLIIGHYSARYDDLTPLLLEAKTEFQNTVLGIDGQVYEVLLERLG